MFAPLHHRGEAPIAAAPQPEHTHPIQSAGPHPQSGGVKRQITGVYHPRYLTVLADAMLQLGFEHALVIRGEDGLDEISIPDPQASWN